MSGTGKTMFYNLKRTLCSLFGWQEELMGSTWQTHALSRSRTGFINVGEFQQFRSQHHNEEVLAIPEMMMTFVGAPFSPPSPIQ